jgi:methyltransferase-like protein
MVVYHTRNITEHAKRVAESRKLLAFLAAAAPGGSTGYKAMMVEQRDRIARLPDNTLVHDDLEDDCDPFYVHQVVEHAARHGLAYLAAARFADMNDQGLLTPIREKLGGDPLSWEQHIDFVLGRPFRHTLLVRGDVPVDRRLDGSTVRRLFVVSGAQPESFNPDLTSQKVERFVNPRKRRLSVSIPIAKAAMTVLAEVAPRALTFDELLSAARERLGSSGEADAQQIGELLVTALGCDTVKLSAHRPRLTASPGERPRATRLAREQAAAGDLVTTLDHQNVPELEPVERWLLTCLDGTRDRAALAAECPDPGESLLIEGRLATLARYGLIME